MLDLKCIIALNVETWELDHLHSSHYVNGIPCPTKKLINTFETDWLCCRIDFWLI